jgi:hypothetical protein
MPPLKLQQTPGPSSTPPNQKYRTPPTGEVQDSHFPNLEERPDLPQEGVGDPMSRRDERGVQFDMVDSIIRITAYKALMPIVQLAYVGRLGVSALAGATVALSMANLTGFLAMVGVVSVVLVFCPRSDRPPLDSSGFCLFSRPFALCVKH